MERQDDDSKSVNTASSNNDEKAEKKKGKAENSVFDVTVPQKPFSRSRSPDKIKPPEPVAVGKKDKKPAFNMEQNLKIVKQEKNKPDQE